MADAVTKGVQTMLGEPRRAVLSMVVPVFIALLIGYLNSLVDSVWCSSLGVNALSAINLVSSLYFFVVGIGNGIGVGLNVAISRRIGEGDRAGALPSPMPVTHAHVITVKFAASWSCLCGIL